MSCGKHCRWRPGLIPFDDRHVFDACQPNVEIPLSDSLIDVFRIIDAAANRAREGLRVIEDFVRFTLDDGHLSRILKESRHELTATLSQFSSTSLLSARDTLNDVGTTISTSAEYIRTSPTDVVRAACKRTQEALRTLEEFSKVIDSKQSPRFEQLRYRLYTLEKAVLKTESNLRAFEGQSVYLLVQSELCANGLEAVVHAALDAGVRLFQLREKSLDDRSFVQNARKLREWTAARNSLLIINDRPDIAVLSNADGVHVGQEELTVQDARRIVGPGRLIGVSTHSIQQARQAVLDGADYLGVGPTFPSQTKSFSEFPGLKFVGEVASEIRLPWFAIGGIDRSNVSEVIGAGAIRIATSSSICGDPNPEEKARELVTLMAKANISPSPPASN